MALSNLVRSDRDPNIVKSGPSSLGAVDRLARALGWFSIGLGLAELVAPRRLTHMLGMEGKEPLVRGFGAREIASGVLTLSIDKQVGLWSRVAGDALDVAAVAPAADRANPKRGNARLALAMLVGVAAVDAFAAQAVTSRHGRKSEPARSYPDRSGFPAGVESARREAARASKAKVRVSPIREPTE